MASAAFALRRGISAETLRISGAPFGLHRLHARNPALSASSRV